MSDQITAGAERAALENALATIYVAGNEWKPATYAAAKRRAMAAFDALEQRLRGEQPAHVLPSEVLERIRRQVKGHPKYEAVAIDKSDLQTLIDAYDAANTLPEAKSLRDRILSEDRV